MRKTWVIVARAPAPGMAAAGLSVEVVQRSQPLSANLTRGHTTHKTTLSVRMEPHSWLKPEQTECQIIFRQIVHPACFFHPGYQNLPALDQELFCTFGFVKEDIV